ncbi:MAG: hypothetical protein PHH37_08405 [Paludibacter sp.]|nr:hypothetical protein [Paludibacter sp.]
MILAIDFDGTIVEDKFPGIGNERRNAGYYINKLYKEGYFIIIWSSRIGKRLEEAKQWLDDRNISYNTINESCPANLEVFLGIDTRKIHADMYIDDKGLDKIPEWDEIYEKVHCRLPTLEDTGFPG